MRFIACKIHNLLTKTKPKIIFQKKLLTKLFVYFLEYINIILFQDVFMTKTHKLYVFLLYTVIICVITLQVKK